jgi:hypothetical protein
VLAICERFGATGYINAIGGKELYSREAFAARGIDLHFLRTGNIAYPQFTPAFVPNLSIIDVLMHTAPEHAKEYLLRFELE